MSGDGSTILLVEDDPDDVFFLQYAFQTVGIDNRLYVVTDGQQAIDYLGGVGEFGDRRKFPLPGVVLLDLKLPVRSGVEVLRWVQTQANLAHLLIIVLTASSDASDVEQAYGLGARSYLIKPVSLGQRVEMVRNIKNYWLDLNQFPTPPTTPRSNPLG